MIRSLEFPPVQSAPVSGSRSFATRPWVAQPLRSQSRVEQVHPAMSMRKARAATELPPQRGCISRHIASKRQSSNPLPHPLHIRGCQICEPLYDPTPAELKERKGTLGAFRSEEHRVGKECR